MIAWLLLFGGVLFVLTIPPRLFGLLVGWCVGWWLRRTRPP